MRAPGDSFRHYAPAEMRRIHLEGRGVLEFAEATGVLESSQRDVVVDRIMALDEPEIGIEQVKLIVLMVLWNQGQATDPTVPAERPASERPGALH